MELGERGVPSRSDGIFLGGGGFKWEVGLKASGEEERWGGWCWGGDFSGVEIYGLRVDVSCGVAIH